MNAQKSGEHGGRRRASGLHLGHRADGRAAGAPSAGRRRNGSGVRDRRRSGGVINRPVQLLRRRAWAVVARLPRRRERVGGEAAMEILTAASVAIGICAVLLFPSLAQALAEQPEPRAGARPRLWTLPRSRRRSVGPGRSRPKRKPPPAATANPTSRVPRVHSLLLLAREPEARALRHPVADGLQRPWILDYSTVSANQESRSTRVPLVLSAPPPPRVAT